MIIIFLNILMILNGCLLPIHPYTLIICKVTEVLTQISQLPLPLPAPKSRWPRMDLCEAQNFHQERNFCHTGSLSCLACLWTALKNVKVKSIGCFRNSLGKL
jgi:hypothetical protein